MTPNTAKAAKPSWIPDTTTFGARLALVRWHMGWNVAEAERECGVTQNLWANWEAGSQPRNYVEVIGKISWASKVDRIWLMTGDGSPEPSAPEDDSLDYRSVGSRPVVHLADARAIKLQPSA